MLSRGLRSLGGKALVGAANYRRAVTSVVAPLPIFPLESPFVALGRLWTAPAPTTPLSRVQQLLHGAFSASVSASASASAAPAPSAALTAHLVLSSTVKKRAMKMNKHKLKKRRKLLRMNTKISRG